MRCSSRDQAKLRPRIVVAQMVLKKVRRSIFVSPPQGAAASRLSGRRSTQLLSPDRFRCTIPHGGGPLEIGIIRQMAANCRIVAEFLILYRRLSRAESIEEIRFVVYNVVVVRWNAKRFCFFI